TRAAQPTNQERCAFALRRGDDEIGEGDASEIAAARARECAASLINHRTPLGSREQGRLPGMGADRENQPIGEPDGLAYNVEVSVGDGIERPRKKRGARHEGGLACAPGRRKVSGRAFALANARFLEAASAPGHGANISQNYVPSHPLAAFLKLEL